MAMKSSMPFVALVVIITFCVVLLDRTLLSYNAPHYATKDDIQLVEMQLQRDIVLLKGKLDSNRDAHHEAAIAALGKTIEGLQSKLGELDGRGRESLKEVLEKLQELRNKTVNAAPTQRQPDAGLEERLEAILAELRAVQLFADRMFRLSEIRTRRKGESIFPAIRKCDVPCNNRGLSVDATPITNGCECVCLSGWRGDLCQQPPPGYYQSGQHLQEVNATPPTLKIPLEREEVPPIHNVKEGCKEAAKQYYLERYRSEEFRTDAALKFFWFLARNSMMPQCSTPEQQTVVIDIGAKVGEQFEYWEREFLNLTQCPKPDTLLILVEPNPTNLVHLRYKVREWEKNVGNSSRSGKVLVQDLALSYYSGSAKFVVNLKQDVGAQGNERGSLDVKNAKSDSATARTFWTRVETLSTMLTSLPYGYLRANYSISVLKIDAEGYDPAIIYGSQGVLSKTNIVIFECHKLWKSSGFTFKDVAEFFAKSGFSTYKIGMFYWIPVTPPAYWDDVYDETLQWSNCIAIRNGHSFSHMFSLPPPCDN